MNLGLIGFALSFIGEIMIAYTAIMVHHRFWREHKINDRVFRVMKLEQVIGVAGIVLIIIGFLLQLPTKI